METYGIRTAAGALETSAAMPQRTTDITGDMLADFLGYCDVSEKSRQTYRKSLRPFFRWIADNHITRPQYRDILAYKDAMKDGRKPTTVQAYITAVKLFFSWAEIEGLYPDVARHIKGARLDREHKKDALTAPQVKDVMRIAGRDKTLTGLRNRAMLMLMFACGLRCVEVARANTDDIAAQGGIPVLYVQGKGHEERAEFVKLPAPVEKAVRDYLAARKAEAGEPLFVSDSNNNQGGRLRTNAISLIIKRAFAAAGLVSPRLTAHSTRHTAVTLALLAGDTIQEAAQFARHKNIGTTQIYAHNLSRLANPSENRIAAQIF